MDGRNRQGSPTAAAALMRGCEVGVLRVLGPALCASVLWLALTATGAAATSGSAEGPPPGPKSPPFTQCPPVGADTACEYLIDVTSTNPAVPAVVVRDPNQPVYEGEDDVLVGIQNDTSIKLERIHIGVPGSGDALFALDGDGVCWEMLPVKPSGCPFDLTINYDGPDAALQPESTDAGTVAFPTPLKPGQYTYFSLEAPPTRALVAGAVNDTVSTTLTNAQTHESGIALAAPAPVPVTDRATIKGPHGAEATGTVEYLLYSDPGCTKVVAALGTKRVEGGLAEPSDPSSTQLPSNSTYFWVAKYSGDVNNSANTSGCGSETMSFGTPPRPPVVPGRPRGGSLRLLSLRFNASNGQITVTAPLPGAGTFSADAVVRHGATLARVTPLGFARAAKKCRRGSVARRGRCVNDAPVLYGAASLNASAAGTYTLVIKPSKRVLQALRKGKTLVVKVSVEFQPVANGAAVTNAQTLVAKLKRARHRKH
jgi:hypothetical protein